MTPRKLDSYQREQLQRSIEARLAFMCFANMHFISTQKRQDLTPL